MATQHDLRKVLDAVRGLSLTPEQADYLRIAIDCRVGAKSDFLSGESSKSTAECALTAVYAAIEAQAGHQDANLAGLAALVSALKPRTLPTSGMVSINVPDDARLGMVPTKDRT